MKEILIVIAPKDFQDTEYQVTREVLEENGCKVTTASTKDNCTGVFGAQIKADILLDKVGVGEYQGIVLIGGGGAEVFIDNQKVHQLLKNFYNAGKIVAAICLSPAALASAGLLKDKKATVFPDPQLIAILKQHGADYIGNSVEQDGRIITAAGPTAANDFAQTIVNKMREGGD